MTIFTRTWQGERPGGLTVELIGRHGLTNISRDRNFLKTVEALLPSKNFDGIIGFNKLPALDVYYAADSCYVARVGRLKPAWHRWLPRYRHFRRMEEAVFAQGRTTQILLLTPREIPLYQKYYGTESERLHVLPPGIARRKFSGEERSTARRRLRAENGWPDEERLVLLVGSGFRTKGLDRAIIALASLPPALRDSTRLVVIGQNNPGAFRRQAEELGVAERVDFLGGRDDVPEWLLAAEALIHPAYSENTGTILLEAVAAGLPVLTTETCGFAIHIERAKAGRVLASPFVQGDCNAALVEMLTSKQVPAWRANGLTYAATEDLYGCHEGATDLIEEAVRRKLACRP